MRRLLLYSVFIAGCVGQTSIQRDDTDPDTGATDEDTAGGDATGGDNTTDDDTPTADSDPTGNPGDDDFNPPPHEVGSCDDLGEVGAWEAITPPDILPFAVSNDYGTNDFVLDPNHAGTVYLGTAGHGIWKSVDCGKDWEHVNVGTAGPYDGCWIGNGTWATALDGGRQWTMLIDPVDSNILYANNGYGSCSMGLFKSLNGGVDWMRVWPPIDEAKRVAGLPDFIGVARMDPEDRNHIILDFHADCSAPFTTLCLAETLDGGETWRGVNGPSGLGAFTAHSSRIYMLTSDIWIFGAVDKLWRTPDRGDSWTAVANLTFNGDLYRAQNGDFFLGGKTGIYRSANEGLSWTVIPNSGEFKGTIESDGERMYTTSYAVCQHWVENAQVYSTSDEDDGNTWTTFPSPGMTQGGRVQIDRDHHVLYSSNCAGGFWRVRLE